MFEVQPPPCILVVDDLRLLPCFAGVVLGLIRD
jgi:hypothetical protein